MRPHAAAVFVKNREPFDLRSTRSRSRRSAIWSCASPARTSAAPICTSGAATSISRDGPRATGSSSATSSSAGSRGSARAVRQRCARPAAARGRSDRVHVLRELRRLPRVPARADPRLHDVARVGRAVVRRRLRTSPAGSPSYYYLGGKQRVFKIPDRVSDAAAAGANCALAQVIHGLDEARLRMGETVVVQGAGGLGLYACAVAEGDGRPPRDRDRLDRRAPRAGAQRFGADEVIDMTRVADPRARVNQVMKLTDNWGADLVVEVAGVPEACNEGIRMTGRGGRYLELGNISAKRTFEADPRCGPDTTARSSASRCIRRRCSRVRSTSSPGPARSLSVRRRWSRTSTRSRGSPTRSATPIPTSSTRPRSRAPRSCFPGA